MGEKKVEGSEGKKKGGKRKPTGRIGGEKKNS